MKRKIHIYEPGLDFPSVSTTGSSCSLCCDHCRGHYLRGMKDVSAPDALLDLSRELVESGGLGFLLSGGCDPAGRVVLTDHILDQLRQIKETTPLKVNLHTGLVDPALAASIASTDVDTVSLDIVGDKETIRQVLHLEATPSDYRNSYRNLVEAGVRVVPHVLCGLHHGKLKGESKAVEMMEIFSPERAVLITLIPTIGTPMESIQPPPDREIIELAGHMSERLDSHLILGCMRKKGDYELEFGVIESGFDGIVLPARRTREMIEEKGWETVELHGCCSL